MTARRNGLGTESDMVFSGGCAPIGCTSMYGATCALDATAAGSNHRARIVGRLCWSPTHFSMAANEPHPDPPPRRSAGPLQIARAVFWGFFGVRKQRGLEQDVTTIKPQHIVIAGVIGAALFVLLLILIVRLIVANA